MVCIGLTSNMKLQEIKDCCHTIIIKKAGACFGQSGEYERPMWYALDENKPSYQYSFNYQNWYPSAKHETINARKNVGLFDFSTFSKFDLKGEKVHSDFKKICTANIKNENWKNYLYTHA